MKVERDIPYRSYGDLYSCISQHATMIPNDIDLVVGVPRSGMIPAYMIGAIVNKQVCSLDELLAGIYVSHGVREIRELNKKNKCLIVDDSIHSGVQLGIIKQRIIDSGIDIEPVYLAVYARAASANLVNLYFEIVDTPRVFQWNYMYQGIVEKSAFDIDGVLCVDPTVEQNDDGEKYLDFIKNAKPLFIPQYKIHSIVTSRLEKYRKETEQWLAKNHIKYGKLYMLDLPSKEERIKQNAHASFKADIYAKDAYASFFYESERKQAIQICALSNKKVFCIETGELFDSNSQEVIDYLFNRDAQTVFLRGRRILLYTQELTYTGSPHSLLRIARALKKQGAYVEVWSKLDGDFKKEFEKEYINVHVYEDPFLTSGKCAKMISTFDLAIANTVLSHKFYLSAYALIPTIWYIREATNLAAICKFNSERENALKNAKKLFCVSEYAQNYIKNNYNNNVAVVHNCVEDYFDSTYKKVDDTINIIALGTINYRKAFDVFFDAYFGLPAEYQEKIHLYFAGRLMEENEDYWKPYITKIKEYKNITYLGEINDTPTKIDIMRQMDVFCIVSRDESCSLVTLEGAMLGKPLIVSENVGAKYIVDKDNGWIVRTDNVMDLSNVFRYIVDNPTVLEEMGHNSRDKYLSKSSMDVYNANIVEMVLEELREQRCNPYMQLNEVLYRTEKQLSKQLTLLDSIKRENADLISTVQEGDNSDIYQYQLQEIRKSFSYRVGRAITLPFRFLRHVINHYPM